MLLNRWYNFPTYILTESPIFLSETLYALGNAISVDRGGFWHGVARGFVQGDYFEPSNLTERLGAAIGQIAVGFTPAGILADIRDLTASVDAVRREGFGWGTASGVLLAGIGLIPGVGDTAKVVGKLVRESLSAPKSRGVIQVAEAMSRRSAEYQAKITGLPAGQAYELNGIKFDGFKDGILLEAKGPGYQNFIKDGQFAKWWENTGLNQLLDQANRQIDAAQGRRIQWHFAEEEPARLIRELFTERTINIEIIFTP